MPAPLGWQDTPHELEVERGVAATQVVPVHDRRRAPVVVDEHVPEVQVAVGDRGALGRGERSGLGEQATHRGRAAPQAERLDLGEPLLGLRRAERRVTAAHRIERERLRARHARHERGVVERPQEPRERAREPHAGRVVEPAVGQLAAGEERAPVERPREVGTGLAPERRLGNRERQERPKRR